MSASNKSHGGGAHKRGDGSDAAAAAEHAVQRDPDIRGVSKGRRESEPPVESGLKGERATNHRDLRGRG